jgi:hypothetical protein
MIRFPPSITEQWRNFWYISTGNRTGKIFSIPEKTPGSENGRGGMKYARL